MDGMVGGWMDGIVGGWMDRMVGGWMDGMVGGWMDGWILLIINHILTYMQSCSLTGFSPMNIRKLSKTEPISS